MKRTLIMAAIVTGLAVPAQAQQQASAELFARGKFAGPAMVVTKPSSKMAPFEVKSLRITPGTAWDLCSGNTFTGCRRFRQSQSAMVMTVRSVRAVTAPIAQDVSYREKASTTTSWGSGPSLRGLESEFFVLPAEGGARVEVSTGETGAESRTATAFCRTHGWRSSAYERVQTVDQRRLLADVLCVNEDR